MKKNAKIHFMVESNLLENLKNQAEKERVSIAELCREKLRKSNQLDRIENILIQLLNKPESDEN
ncbi:MAG: hypothetical protein PHF67_04300 [Candidatus Nanoarchaeia archaeon]|nr:hypothetical protein [Candidatus Nanoarchaeia archaeon]